MSRFRLVKNSRKDKYSATGHAAPSWHTFDQKVWERETPEGTHRVTLTKAPFSEERLRTGMGRNEYLVTFEREGHAAQVFKGTSWQALVREAKELSKKLA